MLNDWIVQNWGSRANLENIKKMGKMGYDYFKKLNGSYVYPNGFLGATPVYITNFKFSNSNKVTGNATIYGDEISDNINIGEYDITLTVMCFGRKYLDDLKSLQELSQKNAGLSSILPLYYEKTKTTYSPLVITSIDFTDSQSSTMFQTVTIKLKQIKIFTLGTRGEVIVTETLSDCEYYSQDQPSGFSMPLNLLDELKKTKQYQDLEKEIKNVFKNYI